jgi:hypothetical protein
VGTTVRVVLPVKQKVEFAVVSDWTTVEQKI